MKTTLYLFLIFVVIFGIAFAFYRYMVLGDINYDTVPLEELGEEGYEE